MPVFLKSQTPILIGSVMIVRCILFINSFPKTKWNYFNFLYEDNKCKLEIWPLNSYRTTVLADELNLLKI